MGMIVRAGGDEFSQMPLIWTAIERLRGRRISAE